MLPRYYTDAPGSVSFDEAPEMQPFLDEPDGMYVGCPGKHGYLNLGFVEKNGRTILRELNRRAPLIVQQELYFDEQLPDMPCVYILSSGGPNVDGDRYEQNFTLGPDTMAYISTGAATKLASMNRNYSGMVQRITLDAGAYLEYLPEPIIPCRNTRFISDTLLTVHPTATAVYSEVYMGGRKYYKEGEMFAYDILSVTTRGRRPDGTKLFREKFVIEPGKTDMRAAGMMGRFDVFANMLILAPPEVAEAVYAKVEARWEPDGPAPIACGITRLPNGAGLLFKALGVEPGPVKAAVREVCSIVRMQVKGKPMPAEFPWR